MSYIVQVVEVKLTDGSLAYNVMLAGDEASAPAVMLHAVTERDAYALASSLVENIRKHTVEEVSRGDALYSV